MPSVTTLRMTRWRWPYPAEITQEQIDRCSPVIDMSTGELFWLVLSERDDLTEYKVSWLHRENASYLTCSCPAGTNGNYCKHRRWVFTAKHQYQAEQEARTVHRHQALEQASAA